MGELVALTLDDTSANIDLQGAWLTQLQSNGKDILFPRQEYVLPDGSKKMRGGSHVCFPNFGPGGSSGLPQHGFARVSTWRVSGSSESKVELLLEAPEGDYAKVEARLSYELVKNGIRMALTVLNNGTGAVPISPAFHPYFATDAIKSIVHGTTYNHDNLGEAVFLSGPIENLYTASKRYDLLQENLPQWVLWTDNLGKYICLEPTAVGNGFEAGTALPLQSGESWVGTLDLRINER